MDQVNHYEIREMVMDCTENPEIVDAQQQNSASSTTSQKNIGLKLRGAYIGVIALVILAPALMPGGKKSGNLEAPK